MPKPLINWSPEFYTRLAEKYDLFAKFFFPLGEKGKKKVVENLKTGKILDVACGSGMLLSMAQEMGIQPFGIDISWGMLSETRRKIRGAKLVQASFYELPFKRAAFDTVVETNAVSGAEDDSDQVLEEMLRVTKASGEVRIGDYAQPPKLTPLRKLTAWVGQFFGDYPHDYVAYFRNAGQKTQVEYLGFDQMYQFVRVKKVAE